MRQTTCKVGPGLTDVWKGQHRAHGLALTVADVQIRDF